MKTLLITLLAGLFLLTACAPTAAPGATSAPANPTPAAATAKPNPYPAAQPTTAAASSANPSATAYPAGRSTSAAAPSSSSKVTFKIVPGESTVQYEVSETFLNQNNKINLAVGKTTVVNGEIFADKANPSASTMGPITVDISQFKSDSGQRDRMIQNNFLESKKYPQAKFVPTQFETLPGAYQDGTNYSFKVTGDMTVHNTTKPVTFAVTARLTGDTLSGTATASILMSDFGVGPISLLGILNTEDQVKLTFTFVARP